MIYYDKSISQFVYDFPTKLAYHNIMANDRCLQSWKQIILEVLNDVYKDLSLPINLF